MNRQNFFARALKRQQKKRKINGLTFCDLLGISRQRMYCYMTEANEPRLTDIADIAEKLDCTFEDLMGPLNHKKINE